MLNIGSKTMRNLPEQVAENLKQIGLIWQKLDGLDVYDNVIILEDLSNLNEEQLAIVARPVSFIVYQDVVYVKKGNVGAYALFSPYYSIEADEYITIKSSELKVQFPLGELTISNLEVDLYDKNEIDTLLGAKLNASELLGKTYPVGAIYMSTVSTSPASLFGGTWEQLENRFLLGAGSSYSAGATGGEATHALDANEIPSHSHIETMQGKAGSSGDYSDLRITKAQGGSNWGIRTDILNPSGWASANGGDYLYTQAIGGSQSHNNMPPYLVVYMWKRTA